MKQPLWILNSALIVVLLFCFAFIAIHKIHLPKKEPLTPLQRPEETSSKQAPVDIKKIYEVDLFSTYQAPVPEAKPKETAPTMPTPPAPVAPSVPQEEVPKFLEPLAITLSGIIAFSDESKNRALIVLTKSNQEKTYKVGDEIEDAQILKIYKNRVILIRSNGQQETVFLTEADVGKAINPWLKKSWLHVVQKVQPFSYAIDPREVTQEIQSLGQLIDLLDLTTVYKQGIPVACKIGALPQGSLVSAMGLQQGDIIFTINGIPAATIEDRMEIYNKVTGLRMGEAITIELQRKNSPARLVFTLQSLRPEKTAPVIPAGTQPTEEAAKRPVAVATQQETNEKIDILKRSKTFAPSYYDIVQDEAKHMLALDEETSSKPREINAELSHENNN